MLEMNIFGQARARQPAPKSQKKHDVLAVSERRRRLRMLLDALLDLVLRAIHAWCLARLVELRQQRVGLGSINFVFRAICAWCLARLVKLLRQSVALGATHTRTHARTRKHAHTRTHTHTHKHAGAYASFGVHFGRGAPASVSGIALGCGPRATGRASSISTAVYLYFVF